MDLNQLHYHEYDKLQTEINQTLSEISSLERFSLLTSGGIFAWLLTHEVEKGQSIAYFIPAILVFLFGVITWGHFKRIKLIADYIKSRYESLMKLGLPKESEFGWETHLSNALGKQGSILANSRLFMWVLHLLFNLVIALILK